MANHPNRSKLKTYDTPKLQNMLDAATRATSIASRTGTQWEYESAHALYSAIRLELGRRNAFNG
jgi:hypothetical protein